MWKRVVGMLGCAAVFMVIGGLIISFMQPSEEEVAHAQKTIDESFNGKISEVADLTRYEIDDLRFYKADGLTEADVQDLIHEMSHQKVKADEKWGALLITEERIVRLIEIVEENYNEYECSDIYLEILNRWLIGDFSQADKDHNEIWNMNGGTIGKATGLLSPVEEQEYLQRFSK